MKTKSKPLFEHATCGRCCGTGNYSYNSVHGTRCYGCGGSGYKLTKRGAAAQKFLDDLRMRPAGSVKVGDAVHMDFHFFAGFYTVEAIEPCALNRADGFYLVATRQKTGEKLRCGCWPDRLVRMGFTEAEKAEQRAQALAYQATLTKAGVPSKRKASA